jgi:NAD(P)-dependent dehydrogenase (short-subunit alcohol dehydrogenase family)
MAKTWFVMGSSRGFGRALSEAILDRGDNLIANARDPEALARLGEGRRGHLLTAPLDVTDESLAEAAIAATTWPSAAMRRPRSTKPTPIGSKSSLVFGT